jgi:hypothetical protein
LELYSISSGVPNFFVADNFLNSLWICERQIDQLGYAPANAALVARDRGRPRYLGALSYPTSLIHMKENCEKLLLAMDEKLWLRMVVCFIPGLVVGKLAGLFPGVVLGVLGTVLLVAGVGIFLAWPRLRALATTEDEEETDEAKETENLRSSLPVAEQRPAAEYVKLMTELLDSFDGSSAEAIDAVHTEIMVNPKLTYVEAIELAHRRKRIQVGKR